MDYLFLLGTAKEEGKDHGRPERNNPSVMPRSAWCGEGDVLKQVNNFLFGKQNGHFAFYVPPSPPPLPPYLLMSRVDYGRRGVSQPPVSRSPSPNRTYTFRYVSGSPEATAYLSYTAESVLLHVGVKNHNGP